MSIEEIYERRSRKRLAVLGVRVHTSRYRSAGPVEPAWASAVPVDKVLGIQDLG